MRRITLPWSYSRWAAWHQCNAKAGFRYGDKLSEPRGSALIRGGETHDAIEAYAAYFRMVALQKAVLGSKAPKLPPHAEFFKKRIDWMIEQGCVFEQRWFFSQTGKLIKIANNNQPKPARTSYWLEIGTDVYLPPKKSETVLYIWDFKTGRVRNYDDQKEIYALGGMIVFPWVDKVICENLFLDEQDTSVAYYFRDSFDRLWEKWQNEVKLMTSDTKFQPNPSRLCNWCGYSKFKGGPCQAAQE